LLVVKGMRLSIRQWATAALVVGLATVLLVACGGGDDDGNATAADAGMGPVSVQSVDGTDVLVDAEGKTLYTADVEKGGSIRCTEGCTSFWDPVDASARDADRAAGDLGLDLGVISRPDGGRQMTFDGLPLYTFTEEGPGQLDGDGFVDDFQGTHFEWAAATAGSGSGGAGSGSSGSDSSSGSSPY
jgi:predicted lipoprotein with Yx(FWY)xxD motif